MIIEYSCPKCGGPSYRRFMGRMPVRGNPDEIRQHYAVGPFRTKIVPWKDNKGCNVTVFADEQERVKARGEPGRAYTNILLCTACHERTGVLSLGPSNYYWRIQTPCGVLWAYNRPHLVDIRDHIAKAIRPQGFHKLPGAILKATSREKMIRLINRALEHGPTAG